MEVNTKIITEWVAALRSRKFKQGKYALRTKVGKNKGDVFCCLGVLCEITNFPFNEVIYGYDDKTVILPNSLRQRIGIDVFTQNKLMQMNDSGKKFYQIARFLERKYLADNKKGKV